MPRQTVKWEGFNLPNDELPVDETLNYETFIRTDEAGWPLYNNFPSFFVPTQMGDTYRKSSVFEKLQRERPELVDRAMKVVKTYWPQRDLQSMNPVIYGAYTEMRSYTIDGKPVLNYPDLFA